MLGVGVKVTSSSISVGGIKRPERMIKHTEGSTAAKTNTFKGLKGVVAVGGFVFQPLLKIINIRSPYLIEVWQAVMKLNTFTQVQF